MPITRFDQLDLSKRYTYADYLTWQFEEFVELIRGRVFKMAAPGLTHQKVSVKLLLTIGNYLTNNPCQIFTAPFDVRLPLPPSQASHNKVDTVVQPDLCVICDPAKLDERGCQGPPDWIIEILSKSTAQKDLHDKFALYQHAGVPEYWVVHPTDGTVIPYRLNDSGLYAPFRTIPYTKGESIPSDTFPELAVDLEGVFG